MRRNRERSRFSPPFPLLAAGLTIGWTTGCAGMPGPTAALTPPRAQVAENQVAGSGEPADDGLPGGDPAPPVAPAEEPLAATPAVLPAAADAAPPATAHDPATAALIAEELALAPAADRPQLAAEWAKLDAAMVEQVIRIRRMVRQLDAKPTPVAATPAAAALPFSAAPAAPRSTAEPARVTPAVGYRLHAAQGETQDDSPLSDPNVRPAAYFAPPIERAGVPPTPGAAGAGQPLFPGLPPIPEPAPLPEPGRTPTPLRPPGAPTRTAEALPPPAALLTPGTRSADRNLDGPYYDPGPTGFGADRAVPERDGAGEFDRRLAALEQSTRRRAAEAALALQTAATPEDRSLAEKRRAEAEIHLRLLHLIAGEHGRALEAVPGLPPAEQEFWQHTFWALSTELDTASIPDPADRATHAVAALRTAAVKLSERANLVLKDVNFCHRVDSFGNVQTFDRDEFTPNEPVLIYAAVENFTSERTLEGRFRTVLRSKVEIFRAGGTELVETLPLDKPMTEDLCDNHRQDYFLIYELKIPARIGLGPHVLKLTVEDTLGDAKAVTELNFTVK